MKRSEVNRIIREAEQFFREHSFRLPPFAFWSPEDWEKAGEAADVVRQQGLGWDLTDLGQGDFEKIGLLLFTVRNGDHYAEKIMISRENQVTPWHFHWTKVEDIINRGGGVLSVELAWASADESALDEDRPVSVLCDGFVRDVPPRGKIELQPGESVTLPPLLYHKFYGAPGHGNVLVGEVSLKNDDRTDNRFLEAMGRFPEIEEDEPPYRLLCNEC